MIAKNDIRIGDVQVSRNRLESVIHVPGPLRRYFLGGRFVAEYSCDISDVPRSILNVPVLSTVMPIAWATGATVRVGEVDERFLAAAGELAGQFRRWFPKFSGEASLDAERVTANRFENEGVGLLFSSGLDSLASYSRHQDRKPTLIPIWGADISFEDAVFWEKVRRWIVGFAEKQGVEVRTVRTNMRELVNERPLERLHGLETWWGCVGHGMMLLGAASPLTRHGLGTMVISATHTADFRHPWGSHPAVDSRMGWADVRVVHDAYELSRQDKIHHLVRHAPECLKYLRICYSQHGSLNCGQCEKCLRTITGLLLEGMDPAQCNFDVDGRISDVVVDRISRRALRLGTDEIFMWQDIQRHIPERLEGLNAGSQRMLRWLGEADLSGYRQSPLASWGSWATYKLRHKGFRDLVRFIRRRSRALLR